MFTKYAVYADSEGIALRCYYNAHEIHRLSINGTLSPISVLTIPTGLLQGIYCE